MKREFLCCVGAFLCANAGLRGGPALGSATSLNIIPTADVLPVGTGNLGFQYEDVTPPYGDEFADQAQSQFGVPLAEPGSVETGLDTSTRTIGWWWNIKWRFFTEGKLRPATAIGVQNVGTGDDPQPYLVAFKHVTHGYRLHFGIIKSIYRWRHMFGLDGPIGSITTFMADYTSGPRNFATVGVNVMLPYNLQLNPALLIGNDRQAGTGYQICLSWQGVLW